MKLHALNLRKEYGKKTVVDNISITLGEGEIVGLLGPNGAGKTTTFRMIVGLITPESGRIAIEEKEITNMPMFMRARMGISYLPQEPSIFRKLKVRENLTAIAEMNKGLKGGVRDRIESLINEFGLKNIENQTAYTLSGGEKRRTEIARALLLDPHFILLDEPFVGIDPITVNEIQGIISRLRAKGIGILITDHNVRETLEIIDRAYIIYEGKILLEGDAKTLLESQQAREVYLGENFKV